MSVFGQAESTPVTREMLDAFQQRIEDPGWEPWVFIGSVKTCAAYGRVCMGWTDEQVADWYARNGYVQEGDTWVPSYDTVLVVGEQVAPDTKGT